MTIEEFGDVMGVDLIIRRYANQQNRYMCQFEYAEVKKYKGEPGLRGLYGTGKCASEAVQDYVTIIKGKWLVINAMTDRRKEFGVPDSLTL